MKTNADVFLNSNVSIKDLTNAMAQYSPIRDYIKKDTIILDLIEMFLEEDARPNLSEDEKCILNNIGNSFTTIFRTTSGVLGLGCEDDGTSVKLNQFKDHLFKFVKDGEAYNIEELLK